MQDKLESVIFKINEKIKQHGITIGDSVMLLSFEIARMELFNGGKISDNTLRALNEVGARTSHFYYFHDYPELYKSVQDVLDLKLISKYNPNAYSYDIGIVGISKNDWAAFLAIGIKGMFDTFKTSAK